MAAVAPPPCPEWQLLNRNIRDRHSVDGAQNDSSHSGAFMKLTTNIRGYFAAVAAAGILSAAVLAHGQAVPLTCSLCNNLLTDVILYLRGSNVGVPAHAHTMMPVDSEMMFALFPGDQFDVTNENGVTDTITIHAEDFSDVSNATIPEILTAVNSQLHVGTLSHVNGAFIVRGNKGGAAASLSLTNRTGAPVDTLLFMPGEVHFGANEVGLTISVPESADPTPNAYAGAPYKVFVSATDGAADIGNGITLPLAVDPWTRAFFDANRRGLISGFLGALDANENSAASADAGALHTILGDSPPPVLYMAFVVYDAAGTTPLYVSNRFTVTVVH